MNRKPYVPHLGVPRPSVVVETKSGTATITNYKIKEVSGHRVVSADNGQRAIYIDLDAHPEIEVEVREAAEKYEQDFVARYPGIYELVSAQNDAEYKYERLQREIENGDGILSNSQPDIDPADVALQYPIAAAYLTICAYCDSDNLDKYGAGRWAVEQLERGASVIETCSYMIDRWHHNAANAVLNS